MPWADAVQHELEANPQYNKLLRAFRLFDKNGDGFMDAAELRDLLQRVNPSADPTKGDPLTEADCAAIISSFDDNGDGHLSVEELCAAWSTIGGHSTALDDAMHEKREEAKAALKKRQSKASKVDGGAEFQEKHMGGPALSSEGVSKKASCYGSAASSSSSSAGESRGTGVYDHLDDGGGAGETAMDRARARAEAKVGKGTKVGGGTMAGAKAASEARLQLEQESMTAEERGKAKAKAALEAKAAKKAAEATRRG